MMIRIAGVLELVHRMNIKEQHRAVVSHDRLDQQQHGESDLVSCYVAWKLCMSLYG